MVLQLYGKFDKFHKYDKNLVNRLKEEGLSEAVLDELIELSGLKTVIDTLEKNNYKIDSTYYRSKSFTYIVAKRHETPKDISDIAKEFAKIYYDVSADLRESGRKDKSELTLVSAALTLESAYRILEMSVL